jgi:hypothetical protein
MTSPHRFDYKAARLTTVLAGMRYPALAWQLAVQADYYGADVHTRADLAALPSGSYADLDAVLRAVRARR